MEKLVAVVNLVLANLVNDALQYIADLSEVEKESYSADKQWDRYQQLKMGFLSCFDPVLSNIGDQKMALDALRDDESLRETMAAVARDFAWQLRNEGLGFHSDGEGPDGDILVVSCFGEGAKEVESVSLQLDDGWIPDNNDCGICE